MKETRTGFTLIEVMIVVAIIGILAAIAIPQYASYRRNAQNAAATSALKNLATAQEIYYQYHNQYSGTIEGVKSWFSPEDQVQVTVTGGDQQSWQGTAQHKNSADVFSYDSANQGLVTP